MTDALRIPRPWFTFTGCALAIAILYWARLVLVPIAFAVLMAFVLAPVVSALQRAIGRVSAVLAAVTLSFVSLALVGWLVTQQLASLVGEIPAYQQNIHQKIRDIRGFSEGGVLEKLRDASEKIAIELGMASPAPDGQPPVVTPVPAEGNVSLDAARTLLERLAGAGLVVALVIFILLEREHLRGRMIRLFG